MSEWFIDIPGASGTSYRYYKVNQPRSAEAVEAVAANYAFLTGLANGNFEVLYVGQADNAKNRLPNHERWNDALNAGMTMVVAHSTQGGEKARLIEERDLIAKWNPPLNVQHRTTG
jgi:hypothetical protein